jgi:hypothetical protein
MQYDLILEEIGELGPWQLVPVVLLWLPAMASGIFVLTYSFTGKSWLKSENLNLGLKSKSWIKI